MVAWVTVIIVLAFFLIVAFSFSFPIVYVYICIISMLASTVGLVYNSYLLHKKEISQRTREILLGEILRKEKYCTGDDILIALGKQIAGDRRKIGEILVDMGAITGEQLDDALKIQLKSR
ncbi:hypothetical protein DRQ36_09775 [bacterium]|nr:MAG: hypothetical protein DRQ36_09775 [bacterium]